ncbi:MAG: FAD-binding oxidoreductase [Bacteroidetes bacterium]|nr:FAD-binding oxidoreductase [Bacteroidota bacterium]
MKAVTVVGSGIIGLTSAILLQENNWQVRLVAKERYDNTLSGKVGAIWFPFEVHPVEKSNRWATFAYKRYQKETNKRSGVSFIPFISAYTHGSNTAWTKLLPEGSVREAKPAELPGGVEKALVSIVPLIEPPKYLPFLNKQFIKNGGRFEKREIHSLEEMASLNDRVVNCTGLGAKALCQDADLHPMRGQILRCQKMDIPSCVNDTQRGALSYVIVRGDDCIIGGTDYENDWNRKVEKSDTDLILNRFDILSLSNSKPVILEEVVGLRPRRSEVRFEFDKHFPSVFHNYGHGGAGFTVAWGCASELARIFSKT